MRGVRKVEIRNRTPTFGQHAVHRRPRTERIIDQRRPPRPVAQSYGSAGAACVGARFAEERGRGTAQITYN
jgi:hypothetical protein